MRNISILQRLVNGFKRQTNLTIWSHLDTLSEDPTVYSEHFKGLLPQLTNNHIYLYINHFDLVLVCLDNFASKDELADEERFKDEPPLYFTHDSHRVSPVWRLTEAMQMIREKLDEAQCSRRVWGVLLSESRLVNTDDMRPIWDDMNITVIDRLEGIAGRTICVNNDDELLDGTMVMEAIQDLLKRPEPTKPESIDLSKLLNEFIEKHANATPEEETDDDEDVSGETESEDDDGKDDDDKEDKEDVDYDPDLFSLDLPSGLIEQNNNISVRAKILAPMDNPRAELGKLVGCKDIKRRIDELLALTRYNQMVSKAFPDAKQHEVSLHSIFFGRPGTGKTTVCKIFGSLLHEAGALSKGHVVVADRGTFIGTLWGDEERSVRQVLEKAQGGVLMIDEAYLLNGKHENDPGRLVVQLLMEVLADETQRDIAVVLCGYKEPMLRLLDSNPGLHSRFPNRFEFNDFTIDELYEITLRRVGEYRYRFTRQAWQKYRGMIETAYQVRDPQSWGNARFVANQLDRIFIQHALRCVKEAPTDGKRLLTLTPSDISPIEVPRANRRIGF